MWSIASPVRRSAALRLRAVADRLDPRDEAIVEQLVAPLVRLGGRWWHRDEIVAPAGGARSGSVR
jgi:hypothetical protein